jgi:serine/threonine protein kinase
MSPETLGTSVYYKESDIYSFGVLAYETMTETDFTNLKGFQIIFAVTNGTYRPDMNELEGLNGIKALLEDCWNKNWKNRPSFETICNRLNDILEHYKSIKSISNQ